MKISVLKLDLKNCILIRIKASKMVVNVEDIYDQIMQQNHLRKDTLKALCFNCTLLIYLFIFRFRTQKLET